MSFFSHLLIQELVYSRPGALNSAGEASYAAQITVPAKLVGKGLEKGDDIGHAQFLAHRAFTETEIKMGDRVWMPALGDDPAQVQQGRLVLRVDRSIAIRGDSVLFTVYLSKD